MRPERLPLLPGGRFLARSESSVNTGKWAGRHRCLFLWLFWARGTKVRARALRTPACLGRALPAHPCPPLPTSRLPSLRVRSMAQEAGGDTLSCYSGDTSQVCPPDLPVLGPLVVFQARVPLVTLGEGRVSGGKKRVLLPDGFLLAFAPGPGPSPRTTRNCA